MKASFSENSYTTSRGLRSFRRLLFPVWTPNFGALIIGTFYYSLTYFSSESTEGVKKAVANDAVAKQSLLVGGDKVFVKCEVKRGLES